MYLKYISKNQSSLFCIVLSRLVTTGLKLIHTHHGKMKLLWKMNIYFENNLVIVN